MTSQQPTTNAKPEAPSTLQQWFPGAVWLSQYQWGKFTVPDLIAAISVAALLVPELNGLRDGGRRARPDRAVSRGAAGTDRLCAVRRISFARVRRRRVGGRGLGERRQRALPGQPGRGSSFTSALALATGVVFIAGLARMGWISNFMSKAVMAGFITAMAITIIVGQLASLTGAEAGSGDTFKQLWDVLSEISDWSLVATAIGVGSVLLSFAIQRFTPKVPAALTAVVITSIVVAAFDPDVSLVAKIPTGLPTPGVPGGISVSDWLTLLLGGAVVALVGFSEGWGASGTIAAKTHDDLNANQEFRAYGVGEMGAGFLGGMVATGSLSKSSVAMAAGAKTQMANLFLALVVIAVLLALSPALKWLPEAALAAVVITAMWGSANPAKLTRIWAIDRVDFVLGLITGIVVLAWDLLPAMITGIVLSIIYLVYKTSFPSRAELGRIEETGDYETAHWESSGHKGEGNRRPSRCPA